MLRLQITRISFIYIVATALSFVGFSIYLLFTDSTFFRGIMGFISACTVLLPRVLFVYTDVLRFMPLRLLAIIEIIMGIMLSLNGIGALGFYLSFQYYDLFLHVFNPLLLGELLFIAVAAAIRYYPKYGLQFIQYTSFAIGFGLLVLWEIWEWFGDLAFGTHMSGQIGDSYDTISDLGAGIVSLLVVYYINRIFLKRLLVWAYR